MVTDYKKQGTKNRKSGSKTEAQVRAELEAEAYIVCRWQNNVDLDKNKLVGAKPKYNPFKKMITYSSVGFPDFIVIKPVGKAYGKEYNGTIYGNIAVESKRNGYLDPIERQKAQWLLDNDVFNKLIVAKKSKEGHIIYTDFKTKEELKVNELFN